MSVKMASQIAFFSIKFRLSYRWIFDTCPDQISTSCSRECYLSKKTNKEDWHAETNL